MHSSLEQHLQLIPVAVDGYQFLIHQIPDFNLAIDDYLRALSQEGHQEIPAHLAPYFASLWPSAIVLAQSILKLDLAGKSIFEIGCGLAFPSLCALARGAKVTAVDVHPHVSELLERNLRANAYASSQFEYFCEDWKDETCLGDQLFDYVIASDVLYEEGHADSLAGVIDRHLLKGGTSIVVDPCRWHYQSFVTALKARSFQVSEAFCDHFEGIKKSRLITIRSTR